MKVVILFHSLRLRLRLHLLLHLLHLLHHQNLYLNFAIQIVNVDASKVVLAYVTGILFS
jgi:hypothetical protein